MTARRAEPVPGGPRRFRRLGTRIALWYGGLLALCFVAGGVQGVEPLPELAQLLDILLEGGQFLPQ